LILRYETSAPEYSNKTGFSTLIDQLVDANLLREDEAGHLLPDRHIATLLAHAMPFIPPETRQVIEGMACADPEVLR
jgi:glycerol-3-phosphate O-acyltransferase